MSEKSYFFGSSSGDRKYTSVDFAKAFETLFSTGVFAGSGNLLVSVNGSDRVPRMAAGSAIISGRIYNNDAEVQFAPSAAHASLMRYDRVVLKLDLQAGQRKISAIYKTGTPSVTPLPPDMTRDADEYEISLCKVRIPAGSTTITAQDITDERDNASVCGRATASHVHAMSSVTGLETALANVNAVQIGGVALSGLGRAGAKNYADLNTALNTLPSGIYATADYPESNYEHIINLAHLGADGYGAQIRVSYFNENMYFRNSTGDVFNSWRKLWHEANDGAGSGLDADKIKGQNITVVASAPSNPAVNDVWIDIS